jgi:hypothetical protein
MDARGCIHRVNTPYQDTGSVAISAASIVGRILQCAVRPPLALPHECKTVYSPSEYTLQYFSAVQRLLLSATAFQQSQCPAAHVIDGEAVLTQQGAGGRRCAEVIDGKHVASIADIAMPSL